MSLFMGMYLLYVFQLSRGMFLLFCVWAGVIIFVYLLWIIFTYYLPFSVDHSIWIYNFFLSYYEKGPLRTY